MVGTGRAGRARELELRHLRGGRPRREYPAKYSATWLLRQLADHIGSDPVMLWVRIPQELRNRMMERRTALGSERRVRGGPGDVTFGSRESVSGVRLKGCS